MVQGGIGRKVSGCQCFLFFIFLNGAFVLKAV